jgi:hypothetical protein
MYIVFCLIDLKRYFMLGRIGYIMALCREYSGWNGMYIYDVWHVYEHFARVCVCVCVWT